MAVYGNTDLQQKNLSCPCFQNWCRQTPPDSTSLICWTFFSHSEMLVDSLSEIYTLAKLMLVTPATNAVSERSFSALKRLKTHLTAIK